MLLQGLVKSEFWKAVKEENLSKVEEYVRKYKECVNLKDKLKRTPLYYALLNEDMEMAEFLVQHGADLNVKNIYGKTPFHIAVEKEDIELIKWCLKNGADINIEMNTGEGPLDIATEKENIEIVEFLLDRGARPNGSRPDSALHRAVCKGSYDIVTLLLRRGANPILLNKGGNTPLALAKRSTRNDRDKIIKILNKYAIPRHALEKKDNATLRESLEQYTFNKESDVFARVKEYDVIENYLYLLRNSQEVLNIIVENKFAKKRISEIKEILNKDTTNKDEITQLKEEVVTEKAKLRNNREMLSTIKKVQGEVDTLASMNIVDLIFRCKNENRNNSNNMSIE